VDVPLSYTRLVGNLAAAGGDDAVYRQVSASGAEQALTWPELDLWSRQLAGVLAERGLGFGDRLAIGLRNSPQFVTSVFAAWRLGAVPVPMRWDLPEWELGRLREVIAAPVNLDSDDLGWIDDARSRDPIEVTDVVSPNMNGICSSGSTGLPKVILSALAATVQEAYSTPLIAAWGREVPRPQVILVLAPMYHTNGFATIHSLLGGDRLVVIDKFDAAQVVDLIERHRVTTFTATPTMLKRIADLPDVDDRDLSSLEWILQGAAPMPPSLVRRWADLIGAERIIMAYGMTEGLGVTALSGEEWMARPGSVGRGLRETELRILDVDGTELPSGEIGDIYLRSPVYGGYIYVGGAPLLRGTDDGFQTAGDMGYLDDEGFLYLVDRRVDLIISGGVNVFPAEVETALIDHPKIADVVVIGLRDEEWGRRVHAVIQLKEPDDSLTTDEVIAYAKDRLAPHKVPKTIEIVDEIPRSAATKVNRGALVAARGG
jgi:bile acid-coenzyme A ligase